jgi:fluoride ion exporter CrcB/FEX
VPSFATCRVAEILSERQGLQRVRCDNNTRAYNLTDLTGRVDVGDEVVVNTTALELGLGTGGWHVVHWNLAHSELRLDGSGHIMKMRYTSLQTNVGSFEEHHELASLDLMGTPVIVCSLHSQMGVVAAVFHSTAPDKRLAYVMTDGAALPLALSDLVHDLRERDLLSCTVTAGNAFGGDVEAVNVASAFLAARHVLRADAIVVAMGPGVVGTGTTFGTTALEVVDTLNWAVRLNGRPVLALRVSDADERDRHRGLSHHSATAVDLLDATTPPVVVAVPTTGRVEELSSPNCRIDKVAVGDVGAILERLGLAITTMGRDVRADPAFFRYCAAAAIVAARSLERP